MGIYSPNHLHYFTVFQGIGLTGGRSTPINPLYTEEEVQRPIDLFLTLIPISLLTLISTLTLNDR